MQKMKLGNKVINLSAEKGDIKVTANLQNKTVEKENTDEENPETNGKHKVFE